MRNLLIVFAVLLSIGLSTWRSTAVSAGLEGPPDTCNGLEPTITRELLSGPLYGTGGPDVIVATAEIFRTPPVVYGFGGDDSICVSGAIVVEGGSGNDYIESFVQVVGPQENSSPAFYGGAGHDTMSWANTLYGGTGNDVLSYAYDIFGEAGNDAMSFADLCDGGSGIDTATECELTPRVP
jgi:Ca2+-binding RTX toxin-like protein